MSARFVITFGITVGSVALALGAAVAQPAAGPPQPKPVAAPLTTVIGPGVTVDWSRGVVVARGFGPADRHAPEPAVARVAAERRAIDQARTRLTAALDLLPWTGAPLSATARTALAAEVAAAPVVSREPATDGSVVVELGLGVEALRQAATGPRPIALGSDDGDAALVVLDARKRPVRPAIGLAIDGAGGHWTGPITFVTAVPAGAKPRAVTAATTAAALVLDGALPPAGARVVVVVTQPP